VANRQIKDGQRTERNDVNRATSEHQQPICIIIIIIISSSSSSSLINRHFIRP